MILVPPQTHHKIIVKNTIALYLRMFVMMGISLYTTRVILDALGVVDYGIYNVVGGLIAIMTTITGALTISVQRFLNYEHGKDNGENISRVFSSAVIIHLIIAILVLIILETLGLYYLKTSINIPVERYNQALVVYHLSSLSACITLAIAPYTSLIISYERMDIFAFLSILDALLKLGIVYLLLVVQNGRLILYAQLILCVTAIQALLNLWICKRKFVNVRLTFKFKKKLFLNIFSFASWSAFGQLAWAFTTQGTNILLNLFFGTVLNAAYGITMQVQAAVTRFVQSFQTALTPQIIKSYAKNDISEFSTLIIRGSKYSGFLLLFIEIPLFFEIKNILGIWLKDVPEYTSVFCQLMMINAFLDTLSNLLATAYQAYGKIKRYQLIISIILFLNFPISYIVLLLTNIPYVVYPVYGVISVLLLFARIYLVSKYMKIELYRKYTREVLWPLFKVLTIASFSSWVIYRSLYDLKPLIQIFIVGISCLSITLFVVFFCGLKYTERTRIARMVLKRIKR